MSRFGDSLGFRSFNRGYRQNGSNCQPLFWRNSRDLGFLVELHFLTSFSIMNFNICHRSHQTVSLTTHTVMLAVFAFFLINSWNAAAAQSTRRSSPASGKKFRLPKANTATETEVRRAYLQSMAGENVKFDDHKTVFDWLTETFGKEKWRKIQWRHDLWDARIEAAKTGKPIFIWAMNGDPLGCV